MHNNTELVDHRGEPFNPQHVGRAPYGRSAHRKVSNIAKLIPINGDALYKTYSHIRLWKACGSDQPPTSAHPRLTEVLEQKRTEFQYTKPDDPMAFSSYLHSVCDQLETAMVFADSMMPNPLQESASGRLYRSWLQRCHRVVRMAALHEMWCFDFHACHHVIFQFSAREAGIDCPYLDEYLQDKQAYREALAAELDVLPVQAKEALITLAYGAGITHRERYGKPAAIPAILGIEAFMKVKESARIKGLAEELKVIAAYMRGTARTKNSYLLNALWLPMKIDGNSNATQTAHLVQGIEAQMLSAAIRAHHRGSRPGRYVVQLPLHDGWITRLKRDPEVAALAVKLKTGIDIKVECKQYDLIDLQRNK